MKNTNETLIDISEPPNDQNAKKSEINILCFDLSYYSHLTQFVCCCLFVFICYLAYGYYLELIFSVPEVKPVSLYITLIQFLITMTLSFIESLIRNSIQRKVPLKMYALLAALTLGTMSLSNLALSYLNYPTQLIFKSCKMLPVMMGSIFILKKKYGLLDYVAVFFMSIGLVMFTTAEIKVSPNFNAIGIIVIILALFCDAIIGNVQEKAMRQYQASNNEVVFYSYAIASVYLFVFTGLFGIFRDGFVYCSKEPFSMYTNIILLSVSGYIGLQAVLTLVRISGATIAVSVTTMRKAFSITISFLLFNKPFMFQYVWSGVLVVIGIYFNLYSKKHPQYIPLPLLTRMHNIKKSPMGRLIWDFFGTRYEVQPKLDIV